MHSKDIQEGETAEPGDGLDVGMRVGGGPGFSLGWLGGWVRAVTECLCSSSNVFPVTKIPGIWAWLK